MSEKKSKKPKLQLIPGDLHCETSHKSIRIVASPKDSPPFELDAMAFEEDTFLIMSAEFEAFKPDEHIIRTMNNLLKTKPEQIGTVIVRGRKPFKFMCIVHDVSLYPTSKEEWIKTAIQGIFEEAERRKLRSIGLPLIGTLYGTIKKQRFAKILKLALEEISLNHLKRIWLVAPVIINKEIIEILGSGSFECR